MRLEESKYPIGHYKAPASFSHEVLAQYISVIEDFPKKLIMEVESLSKAQLDVPYRPDGWTITQVVNHCADSHMNALIRVKLALTEETPIVKPYRQELWAELADGIMPIHFALLSIEGVHARWVKVLRSLTELQWKKEFIHPEKGRTLSLKESTGSYAWHCDHHLAHITNLKKRMGWT